MAEISTKQANKQRKRNAVGEMKELASEVGCSPKRQLDLSRDEFESLHSDIAAACRTPEQRKRLESARQMYFACPEPAALPAAPPLPQLAAAVAAAAEVTNDGEAVLAADLIGGCASSRLDQDLKL